MTEKQIEPKAFLAKLQNKELDDAILLDVREPFEWTESHLKPVKLIPINSIPARMHELPKDKPIYCICAHGIRSYHTMLYLLQNGFADVTNVLGGMAEIERYIAGTDLECLWIRQESK
ncbi:rhodanese-like domain-containing protein [Effusibacillus consociatus]|uniref:Rhodanese-like domain-containing protein n=1 Tax=Effusibacillus consociatus TaxID=1117041 RepID=A0ABV9Q7H3_9BACL